MACYTRKTRRNAGGILAAAGKGAISGSSLGPAGMFGGAALGIVQQILGDKALDKQQEEEKKRRERLEASANYITDLNDAIAFNNQFNEASLGIDLRATMNPNQPLQGVGMEVTPTRIASDVMKVNGPGHALGGVDVDVNLDGSAEVEVEGGEVMKNNAVFSKRLKVPQDFLDRASELGIGLKKDSYAKIAESLASRKKKFEEAMDTFDVPTINTSLAMLDRIEIIYQDLFATQEFSKLDKQAK